ncbi:MAG: hypothetical protein ACOX4O_04825 [Eubacteriales bacterium]
MSKTIFATNREAVIHGLLKPSDNYYMQKISPARLFYAALILWAALLLVSLGLGAALYSISGDVLKEGLYKALDFASSLLSLAAFFALMAVLGISRYYGLITEKITAVCIAAALTPQISSTILVAIYQTDFADRIGYYLISIWTEIVFAAVIFLTVIIAAMLLRGRGVRKVFIAAMGIWLLLSLSQELITTVDFLYEIKDPTAGEIISIITSYIFPAVKAFLGYVLSCAVLELMTEKEPVPAAADRQAAPNPTEAAEPPAPKPKTDKKQIR